VSKVFLPKGLRFPGLPGARPFFSFILPFPGRTGLAKSLDFFNPIRDWPLFHFETLRDSW
jgi:hypothetical protein